MSVMCLPFIITYHSTDLNLDFKAVLIENGQNKSEAMDL